VGLPEDLVDVDQDLLFEIGMPIVQTRILFQINIRIGRTSANRCRTGNGKIPTIGPKG
jgi:hypothetical protein